MNRECDSECNSSWDNELFEILNRKQGRYRIISEQMRIEELKICLKEGGCVLAKDAKKNTLLHIAVEKGFLEVVNFLLKETTNHLNVENGNGETAISIARKLQKNEICKILEERGAKEKTLIQTTAQPTYNQHVQIARNDPSVIRNENQETPTIDPFPTKADGNCFFHAVFGEKNSSGLYEAKFANEMREDYRNFLSQYVSLRDEHMPTELRDQLKKIFSLFLDIPEYLTDRLHDIKYIVAKTKEARKYCEMRVKELKEIIADKCLQDEVFRNNILGVLFSSKNSKIFNNKSDIFTNKSKLINEISNCLEDCALKLYPNLTGEEYKNKYNSETVTDSFLEGNEIFENYMNAITSNKCYIFFEEVPILASLGNVSITIEYLLNGKGCSETFEPNINIVGNFKPNCEIWGKKMNAVIYYQDSHFSYRRNTLTEEIHIQALDQEIIANRCISSFENIESPSDFNQHEKQIVDSKNDKENLKLPPLSTALKIDPKLQWKNFKTLLMIPTDNSNNRNVNELDTEVFPSPSTLVELSGKVYNKKRGECDVQYEKELDLPSAWTLLTTGANKKNGYFGAAFWNSEFRQLVVAHKGTKFFKDVCTDVYGIVLDEYADQMNSAVTFADHVIRITENVLGSDWQLVFTGHSLGGWLAQVTCFCAEFLRRDEDHFIKTDGSGIHAHCVAFDSPGCDAMLWKLTKDFDRRYDGVITPDKLDISTYLSSPNRVNTYNLHLGTLYRIFPDFSNLNMIQKYTLFYTFAAHSIERITQTFLERSGNIRKPKELEILEVVDWPLSGVLKRGEEYTTFFKWANHFNKYHPPNDEQLPINEHSSLRYKTKEVDDNSCSFRVFSSSELLLLESWSTINEENIILPKIEKFTTDNKLGNYKKILPKFTIDNEKKKLRCETKKSLQTLINRTKQLVRRFSNNLTEAVKNQLKDLPSAVESIYMVESKTFLESISRCDVHFEDRLGLHKFLNSSVEQIMYITSNDVYFDIVRIYNTCEKIKKQNTPNIQADEKNYIQNENIIVLNWQQVLNLKTYIDSHSQLVSKSNKCDLVIIAFPHQVELNEKTKLVLNDVLSGYNEKCFKKLIFVTSKQCALKAYISCDNTGDNLKLSCVHAEPICFSDIAPESRSKILEKPLLDLQGTHFNLSQLLNIDISSGGSLDRIHKILDSNLLKALLVAKTPEVKIRNHMMELHEEVTYAKIGKCISIENTAHSILKMETFSQNDSKPIVFFISTNVEDVCDSETFLNYFNIFESDEVEKIKEWWGTSIVINREHEHIRTQFKQLCHKFFEKRIYWLELKKDSVSWHLVYDSDFYVSRKLHDKFYVQPDVSKVIVGDSYSDLFIFSNAPRNILIDIFKTEDKTKIMNRKVIPILQEQSAITKFEEMKHYDKPVHLIKVEEGENDTKKLIWIRSSGSIDNIRKCVVKSTDSINEKDFTQKSEKIVIFTGEPGVGKSTTVFSLSMQMKSTWVIQKELKNCHYITQLPSKLDIDGVVTFLLKDSPSASDKMAETLLKECLTQESALPVLLIFDGFDEIRIESKPSATSESKLWNKNHEKFIQLFEYLKEKTTARIWITSRTFLSRTLENKFSIIATEIEEFNNEERKQFLTNIWTSRLTVELENFNDQKQMLLQQYIERLFVEAKSILRKDISRFMGAPLHMWMIADVASPKTELFTNNSSTMESTVSLQINNIYDLYQRFIEEKYDIYLHEKSGLSSGLTFASRKMLIENFSRMYRYSAFQLLFPNYCQAFLGSKILRFGEESLRDEEIELNRVGLLHSNLCGEFNFLHQTFAECFVTELFVIWLEKENGRHPKYSPLEKLLLQNILLCPDYKVVRLFMNNILSVRELPVDSLKFYARQIWTESCTQKELLLNKINRSALHIVAEENCECIVQLLLNISDTMFLKDVVPESIDTFFFITSRDNFGHTALYLAGQQKNDDVISKFIEFLNSNSEFVQQKILLSTLYGKAEDKFDPHVNHLLERLTESGNENVQKLIKDIVKNWELIPPFLEAVTQGKLNEVMKKVHECPDSVTREYFVAVKDKNGKSALHIASEEGFQEITEYLLKQGAPVNVVDETGFTPLLFAAKNGHLETVKLLHSDGANISHKDVYNMSAVAWSARQGHLSVVEYLIEKHMDVHIADRNGIDAVQHASKSGHLEVVKLLLKHGANIHRVDRFGKNALSWAAFAGHLHVVQYLLSRGVDAGILDRSGLCAAQVAAKRYHWDVSEWLLNHGKAHVGDVLHRAVCGNRWKLAEKLISRLPVEEGKCWFTPGGTWVTRIKKARKTQLLQRLVEKGVDPGTDAARWLYDELRKDTARGKCNAKKKQNGDVEHKSRETKTCHVVPDQSKSSQENKNIDTPGKSMLNCLTKEDKNVEVPTNNVDNQSLIVECEDLPVDKCEEEQKNGEENDDTEEIADSIDISSKKRDNNGKKDDDDGGPGPVGQGGRGECGQGDKETRDSGGSNKDDRHKDEGGERNSKNKKGGERGDNAASENKRNMCSIKGSKTDFSHHKGSIDEKEDNVKQKLERIIRLGRVGFLERCINETHNQASIEKILADIHQDLATKLVPLLPQMQEAVESRLIQFHLFPEERPSTHDKDVTLSLVDVKNCVDMINEAVSKIDIDYSAKDDVDCVFLHIATAIARYIHVLKRFLKPTFTLLPWNEMEFCLICFLSFVLKPQETDEVSKLILDKRTMLSHLVNFSNKLTEVSSTLQTKDITSKGRLSGRIALVEKIIAQNPEFQPLYSDYDVLRNIYSLRRIDHYIKLAISVDLKKEPVLGKIVIERTLQVLGESLKNTPDSPNVSDDIHRLLLDSAPRQAKDIITSLRDSLSHGDTLTRKIDLESKKDSEFFELVQNDLKKMGTEVMRIFFRKKLHAFKIFLRKIIQCNSFEEINILAKRLEGYRLEGEHYVKFRSKELEKLKKILGKLKLEYNEKGLANYDLFTKINEIVESEESRLMNVAKSYSDGVKSFNWWLQTSLNTTSLRNLAVAYLNILENKDCRLKEIVPLLKESRNLTENAAIFHHFFRLLSVVEYEIYRIQGIDELKVHLTEYDDENQNYVKERVMEIFEIMKNKLKSERNKQIFSEETNAKVKTHESKTKLINFFSKKLRSTANAEVDDINCLPLFDDLNFEGKIKMDLEKSYNDRNFEKCRSLVNTVDDKYNNLIKTIGKISSFSVEKYIIALKSFFSSYKKLKPQINKAIDEIEEEKKIEITRFYYQRVSVLKNILENVNCEREMQCAIEMLVLEATEMLEHASLLADNKFFLLDDSLVLVGKALRNYLAHGDPLIDVMHFSPRTSIITHARALVAQGGDLITQGRVFGRPSKPVKFLEVRSRDSKRKMMAAVQEGMFQAAKKGDLAEIQEWISKGADPQGRSINGKSALYFAIISDNVDTFQFFLEQGIAFDISETLAEAVSEGCINIVKHLCDIHSLEINTKYFKDLNLLQLATAKGKKVVLEYLLGRVKETDIFDDCIKALKEAAKEGYTEIVDTFLKFMTLPNPAQLEKPMIGALLGGHSDIVRLFVEHGVDINFISNPPMCPLEIASFCGQESTVLVLLSKGAYVNTRGRDGKTALYRALSEGHGSIAMILLTNGAEIHDTESNGSTLLHLAAESGLKKAVEFLLDEGLPVNAATVTNWTPLFYAAAKGHAGTVRLLLQRRADVHLREAGSGLTVLHLAVQCGAADVVDVIVTLYPDVVNVAENHWRTSLHFAADNGDLNCVRVLLRARADVFARDDKQRTPLHRAAKVGSEEVTTALLDAGAELDPLDINNVTPLHVTFMNKHRAVSKILIDRGAEIELKSGCALSMLYTASGAGRLEMVRDLIANGADVNRRNENGATPLHAAAEMGMKDIAVALVNAGAHIDAPTINGETPLFCAAARGQQDIVELLASKCGYAVNIPREDSSTPLWTASANGFSDVVATLLRHGAEVNAIHEGFSGTALQVASLKGHSDVVELLLKKGAQVNAPTQNNDGSPLHSAVEGGHRSVAKILLDFGADVNALRDDRPPLENATLLGYEDLAVLLVERGARVDKPSSSGVTALQLAAEKNFVRLTKSLLEHGADPWDVGASGRTPLQVAVSWGHVDEVLALLEHEANDADRRRAAQGVLEEAAGRGHATLVAALLEVEGVEVDATGIPPNRNTALHVAVANGRSQVVEVLLDHGANIEARNANDFTPLHSAAHAGRVEVLATLLRHGASPNARAREPPGGNPLEASALHLAARGCHASAVLLDHNATLNARIIQGHTPLHVTCMYGHTDMVTVLLENGADANVTEDEGRTPLHMAAYNGHTDIILLLMDKQVEVDARDINRWTPLHFAAFHGHPGAIELLVAYGASVNAQEVEGKTPLIMTSEGVAAPEAKVSTAEALLEAKADPNLADFGGFMPLKSAVQNADVSLVSALVQGGANTIIPYSTLELVALNKSLYTNNEELRNKFKLIAGILLSASE